ncbi:MAG TPA: family 43 glycosylhydrolase [Opitutaceae bacterium]|nr:family 43 glycosylhydrolase [Opitutaceae bacterium]
MTGLGLCLALAAVLRAQPSGLIRDVEYGQVDGVSLRLDVNVPDGPGPFPVAILVHGGGWSHGDKAGSDHPGDSADVTPWFAPLTAAHFTWFSVNYRLAPDHPWPAGYDDVLTAIRWVKANAAEYKGDPRRIVIFGHSSGGHYACMVGTETAADVRVQAVVACAPVTDFAYELPLRHGKWTALQNLLGCPEGFAPAALARLPPLAPSNRIRPGLPPFLLIQGDADRTIPLQETRNFLAKLQAAGVPSDLIVVPGAPHRLLSWAEHDPAWMEQVIAWARRQLGIPEAPQNPLAPGGPGPSPSVSAMPPPPWMPDRGDGTYRNPVLFADYSDPDVVRVGDDFWLTASSFSQVPGLPILHSRDLVNWTLVNHALPRLVPADFFAEPRHGGGVWAPAIRYHAGKYWIYYPDPDFGIYVTTAADPRGRWSDPVPVLAGIGLIDPCPFWDDDGRVYLVHAWSLSRAHINNKITLHELSADGTRALDAGGFIIDADQIPGWHTLEGPKLYKRDGWYYIFAPAGGVPQGYQAVFRSKNIHGPYEHRIVLDQGRTAINGPHQGAWVDTPGGQDWFLHFQDRGPYGRVVHLEPMVWRDGWPVIGDDPTGDGKGEPVLVHRKPDVPPQPPAAPVCSDDFAGPELGLQWQWQANSQPGWATVGGVAPGLRLAAVPAPAADSLWMAPNLLMQKFPAPEFSATTRLTLTPAGTGDEAGLIVFGYSYAWIGVRQTATGPRLVQMVCAKARDGGKECEAAGVALPPGPCVLRVTVDAQARCTFAYSRDGWSFETLGEVFQAEQSRWVGAKVGVFAAARYGAAGGGQAQVDWFRVTAE